MAYFFHNTNVLAVVNNQLNFYKPSDINQSSRLAFVAIHNVRDGVVETAPTTTVCRNKQYVIQVRIDGDAVSSFLSFQPNSMTPLLIPTLDLNNLAIFTPSNANIILNKLFNAKVSVGGSTMNGLFAFGNAGTGNIFGLPTDYLPVVISNCAICGNCEGRCTPNGVCRGNPFVSICGENSICGDFNGRCPGKCNGNTTCVQENGKYFCRQTALSNGAIVAIAIAVALIILVIIVMVVVFKRGGMKGMRRSSNDVEMNEMKSSMKSARKNDLPDVDRTYEMDSLVNDDNL